MRGLRALCYLVMGVTIYQRVWSVCVVFWTGSRSGGTRVRGTGGVCRSRGDRGGEPLDIHISIQVTRGSFNGVQRSRNRTPESKCQETSSTTPRHMTARQVNLGRSSSCDCATSRRVMTNAASRSSTTSMESTRVGDNINLFEGYHAQQVSCVTQYLESCILRYYLLFHSQRLLTSSKREVYGHVHSQ